MLAVLCNYMHNECICYVYPFILRYTEKTNRLEVVVGHWEVFQWETGCQSWMAKEMVHHHHAVDVHAVAMYNNVHNYTGKYNTIIFLSIHTRFFDWYCLDIPLVRHAHTIVVVHVVPMCTCTCTGKCAWHKNIILSMHTKTIIVYNIYTFGTMYSYCSSYCGGGVYDQSIN